ncbi:FAD-dependent oxidoreductase [Paenibacillus selenitireducens]|uniref:FAD-dependent oxidoreductase n=1 Tax=Paenibacillus selenitireducens TaxID=1324314 RepID=A0A1T2XM43_9BACL|nr:FAD-dependent oxidoreductase [Paenibacillus selenitireducens]OPA80937.1 FAD-dependent oxidoreductase [Paenibacillus selenitireducens]
MVNQVQASIQLSSKLPVSYTPDVVVVGGGASGVAAAMAAARNGAETLLIEQRGYLGGMGTAALVPAFCPYTDGEKPIIRGIGLELLEKMKLAAGEAFYSRNKDRLDWVAIDVEILKCVYDQEVLDSGAKILFHTFADQVLLEGDRISGLVISNKSGRSVVQAKLYIDATGDADLAALAGVSFQTGGEHGELQPGTMCYVVTGANKARFDQFLIDSGQNIALENTVIEAQRNGDLPQGRKRISGIAWITDTVAGFNFGHIFGIDGTKAEDLTRAAIEGRQLIQVQIQFLRKYVPGFEDIHLVHSGDQIGIRETRRIAGDYTLVVEDYMSMRSFEDDIARNAYFIDIHLANASSTMTIKYLPKGKSHGVPYRCMLPQGKSNLIVAGRSVSSDRPVQGSLRVMPNCFAMGQAAGTAAAMASVDGGGFREISVSGLQRKLIEQGAWLGERPGYAEHDQTAVSSHIEFEEEC